MVLAARQGKTVVRLKGGDPDVFGRSADEIEALSAAGIPYQTVPGVTAALAAAGYAAIPITHGEHSSAVALVTGHERHCKQGPSLDYGALAQFPGTLVFYMGVTSARVWSEALMQRGKAPDTPVAIVRRCSWSDQETIRCTLGHVADVVAKRHLRPPAVIIVGPVAAMGPEVSWFAARPLFGKRVVVTRPRLQAEALFDRLADLGATVLVQPAIEIGPPSDWGPVDRALDDLDRYDWVVFSSANGVRFFLDRLWDRGGDSRRLGRIRLAAIGPGTADELLKDRLRADLVPPEYRAEALAEALAAEAPGRHFLLVRASRGREILAEQLAAAGARVEQVVAYRSTDVERPDADVAAALAAGRIDWITVTSSAIAQALARLFGDTLRRTKLASISPVTSETLTRLGFNVAAEATRYTTDGLVDAMLASTPRGPAS
jgi:uroporphyrinogen III methyltransferase/synthase